MGTKEFANNVINSIENMAEYSKSLITTETVQFDPEKLLSAIRMLEAERVRVSTLKENLKTNAEKLKSTWGDTVSGYGYLWNRFLPTYNEIAIIEAAIYNLSTTLYSITEEYVDAILAVDTKIEELPTEAVHKVTVMA